MNKREAELQRCLEKTLKNLKTIQQRPIDRPGFVGCVYENVLQAYNRITRTLRKGK